MRTISGRVLVVDDTAGNRLLLAKLLALQGHTVESAASGTEALALLAAQDMDVVLLDLVMPGMDGIEVLRAILADPRTRDVPVLMVSAHHGVEHIAQCIELGAVDYITKPFDRVVLDARVRNCIEKKRLRAMQAAYLAAVAADRDRTRDLVYSVLPSAIAQRMLDGETTIADEFDEATVVFADICGFTDLAGTVPPGELLRFLDGLFSAFDRLTLAHGLERVKTIGDAYMVVAGVPSPRADHAQAAAALALALQHEATRWRTPAGSRVQLRIGLNTGPVVAGVIGQARLHYDLWGDAVNVASRMESHGLPGHIQIPEALARRLAGRFRCEPRGLVDVKGKGPMQLSWLVQDHAAPADEAR